MISHALSAELKFSMFDPVSFSSILLIELDSCILIRQDVSLQKVRYFIYLFYMRDSWQLKAFCILRRDTIIKCEGICCFKFCQLIVSVPLSLLFGTQKNVLVRFWSCGNKIVTFSYGWDNFCITTKRFELKARCYDPVRSYFIRSLLIEQR
jgi:hypothetical protein